MRKLWFSILVLALLGVTDAHAGPGKSSFSSPSKPASSSSSKPAAAPSKPSSSWSSPSKPAAPATPAAKPSSSWSSPSKPAAPSSTASPAPTPQKSSWSSPSQPKVTTTTTPRPDATPVSVSKKPAGPAFNSLAAADSKKADSRLNYERSQTPASTYTTPKGETKPINPKDPTNEYLRGRLDESRWVNRTQRETVFYSRYNSPAYPVIVYSDPFHPMYHYWLMDQSLNTAALFIICHEHEMERARVNDMYRRNAQLEAEVARLRAGGAKVDHGWYPDSGDPDLYFNGRYVDATYNPRPKERTEYTYAESGGGPTWGGFWHGVWVLIKWCFYIALALFLGYVVIRLFTYLLFEKRWGA